MSSVATLPLSRLINVDVILAPPAAQGQNLNALLILSDDALIDVVTRVREYSSISEVAADPAIGAKALAAATLYFEQNPSPSQLLIGRWVKTASAGQLIGAPVTVANQLISFWNAITNGGIDLTVNGVAKNLTGLNFSGASNMNGVAAVIQAALTGATIVWDSDFQRLEVTSNTTGSFSIVGFATAGGGTDISAASGLTAADEAYQANGIAAESALACVIIFDNDFGQGFYGLTIIDSVDADSLAVANYVEATSTNKHFFGVSTQESAVLTPGDTTSIAYELSQLALNHTAVQYSSSTPYAVCSLFGRILTTDYSGQNTVINLFYKQDPGIVPENLNTTQADALESRNCNVFVEYNNNTAIIEPGVSSSGNFIDTVMGADALAIEIQTAIYNTLYTNPTKIPQTDAGMHQILTAIAAVCQAFVTNGFLASGVWTANGFGTLSPGDTIPGFYIYAPPVATQDQADRAKRVSVPFQIACKLAGAVNTVDVTITVQS